jgi:hypothetical protein
MPESGLHYEPGMRIDFDPVSRTATVAFRGRVKTLSGLFASEEQARRAGETYCRVLGWNPKVAAVPVHSLMAHRRTQRPFTF